MAEPRNRVHPHLVYLIGDRDGKAQLLLGQPPPPRRGDLTREGGPLVAATLGELSARTRSSSLGAMSVLEPRVASLERERLAVTSAYARRSGSHLGLDEAFVIEQLDHPRDRLSFHVVEHLLDWILPGLVVVAAQIELKVDA